MCVRVTVHNCHTLHNTAQNSSDNFPPHILQTIIIAQMMSIGGEEDLIEMVIVSRCRDV